jgi:HEPN domain-containing protein
MGETMDNAEAALEWLVYAENDFSSAEYLLGKKPLPIEIICFLCQQSAEKALKGLLVLQGIRPPKTHDLVDLHDFCKPFTLDTDKILTQCKDLNDYSVRPRYPDETVITETRMRKALADAKAIMDFVHPLYPKNNEAGQNNNPSCRW